MDERVVITGMGTINGVGSTVQESWENITNAISGVGKITAFDSTDYLVKIACEVKNFDAEALLGSKEARRRDRFEQLAAVAAQQALNQSGLVVDEANSGRIGVIISSAIGGINTFSDGVITVAKEGPRRISPLTIPMLMANGASGMVAIDHGIKGPAFSIASACASGADGIGIAWTLIRAGVIDYALAGASESTITPVGMAAFDRVGAMSRRNDDFSYTPQPFDKNRDGLVMGEGAAVLVLERENLARERGAEVLAELAGYAATGDAYHVTAPAVDGAGGAAAIRKALDSAGVNREQVDYINAHGTATSLNDISETRAIKAAFGDIAYNIPISSTKSMTGHMMGATGALEAVFCVMATRCGVIPPTAHYQTPDPDCDLDYVPNTAREKDVKIAVSNAFGFGGHNAVLVVRKY